MEVPGGQGVQVGDHSTQRNIYIQTYIETLVIKPSPTPMAGQVVATSRLALAQLPGAVVGFTGRDGELDVLARLLDPAASAEPVVVSAVAGLPGVGKTTLAVEAGHAARQQGWFPGGVLFIDLHGYDEVPVQWEPALEALAASVRRCCRAHPVRSGRAGRAVPVVLAQADEPVLVIADNASSEAQVRPLLPGCGPHKVIVTSRHTLVGLSARLVDVTVLDDGAGVEFLAASLHAARPEDDRIAREPGSRYTAGQAVRRDTTGAADFRGAAKG